MEKIMLRDIPNFMRIALDTILDLPGVLLFALLAATGIGLTLGRVQPADISWSQPAPSSSVPAIPPHAGSVVPRPAPSWDIDLTMTLFGPYLVQPSPTAGDTRLAKAGPRARSH